MGTLTAKPVALNYSRRYSDAVAHGQGDRVVSVNQLPDVRLRGEFSFTTAAPKDGRAAGVPVDNARFSVVVCSQTTVAVQASQVDRQLSGPESKYPGVQMARVAKIISST